MSSATAPPMAPETQPPSAAAANVAPPRDIELAWRAAVAAVIVLAGVLRLYAVGKVSGDPFYDAAVRSMTLSWHNFFFGAFDPSASAAIDKPPLDLWLQVASVKIFGFGPTALRLPAALGATLGVGLLYDLVRRFAGRAAGLASALVLALLPVSVLTSRSDTMDSLMMGVLVAAIWLAARSLQKRSLRWLIAAAVLLGFAFNVKLFEALVPVPALLIGLWLAWRGMPARVRVLRLALATAAFAATALAWLVAASLTPAHSRPYPIGSTNGSVWNATFVYNGSDRLLKPAAPSRFAGNTTGAAPAAGANGASRPHIAAVHHRRPASRAPAGPLRLFSRSRVDFGGLIGTVLFAALVFGAIALARSWRAVALAGGRDPEAGANATVAEAAVQKRAGLVALAIWLVTGFVLFSAAGRVHPRYLEAFTPAVAATLGIAVTSMATRAGSRRGALELAVALAAAAVETAIVTRLKGAVGVTLAIGLALTVLTAGAVLLSDRISRALPYWPRWWLTAAATLGTLAAVLIVPAGRDMQLIRNSSGDSAAAPELRSSLVVALSRFLRANQAGARYEFAASAPSVAAQLIVHDARPVTLLTSYEGRPLVSLTELKTRIAAGDVRYVLATGRCPVPPYLLLPQCSRAVRWVRANGRDVTAQLHVALTQGLLYAVTPSDARRQ